MGQLDRLSRHRTLQTAQGMGCNGFNAGGAGKDASGSRLGGTMGWEIEDVEKPFVAQLKGLGWAHDEGSLDDPKVTGRGSFSEVIQEGVLRERLRALNPRPDGQPWLDDARLSEAVAAITRLGTHKLMEANQKATELLIKGLTMEGLPGWDGGRGQTIRYFDWDTPANNRFTVVNQYRIDCPPGYNSGKAFIVPDLVLLVNGIPL